MKTTTIRRNIGKIPALQAKYPPFWSRQWHQYQWYTHQSIKVDENIKYFMIVELN
jgi:hypothetical protein